MRKEKKYHFIYKTTNLLSGRYYIGMHSTNNLDDGYLGSGTYLRRAIRKYGRDNFVREIIEFCNSREELKSREEEVVNLQEIAKKECMNLKVGGHGSGLPIGFKHTIEARKKQSISHLGKKNPNFQKNFPAEYRKKLVMQIEEKREPKKLKRK